MMHQGKRRRLVQQLREKGISSESVLAAIQKVPRHLYIDSTFEARAYLDIPIRIAENQTISQPYTVAYQSQLLELEKGMKVLEIGTGSAYQASVLAELGVQVFSIERIRGLYRSAKEILQQRRYHRVQTRYGDGFKGWPESAPFDRIIVTAAAPEIPNELLQQLKIGGILVIPVGKDADNQRLVLLKRTEEDTCVQEDKGPARFVPMLEGKAREFGDKR